MSNLAALEQQLTAAVAAATVARQSSTSGNQQLSRIPSASDLSDQLRERLKQQQLQELQELQRKHLQQVTLHRQMLLQLQQEQLAKERQARLVSEQQRLQIAQAALAQYTDGDGDDEDEEDDDAATEDEEDPRSLHRTPTPTPATLRQQQQQQQQRPPVPPTVIPQAGSRSQQQQRHNLSPPPPPPPLSVITPKRSIPASVVPPTPTALKNTRGEPRPLQPRPQPTLYRKPAAEAQQQPTGKQTSSSSSAPKPNNSDHNNSAIDLSGAEHHHVSRPKSTPKRKDKLATLPLSLLSLPLPANIDGLPDFESIPSTGGSSKKPKRRYRKTILRQQAQWLAAQINAENERRDAEGKRRILHRLRFAQHSRQLKTRLELARYKVDHELHEQPIHIAEELLDEELEDLKLLQKDDTDSEDIAAGQPPSPSAGRTNPRRRLATMAHASSKSAEDATESDSDTKALKKEGSLLAQKSTPEPFRRLQSTQPKGVRYYKAVVTNQGRHIVRVDPQLSAKRPTSQDSESPAARSLQCVPSNVATSTKVDTKAETKTPVQKKEREDKALVDLANLPHAQEELRAQQEKALKELQRRQLEQLEELKRIQNQQQEELIRVMAETAAALEANIKKRADAGQIALTDRKQPSDVKALQSSSEDKENAQPPLQTVISSTPNASRTINLLKAQHEKPRRTELSRTVSASSQSELPRRKEHSGRDSPLNDSVSRSSPTILSSSLSRQNSNVESSPISSSASKAQPSSHRLQLLQQQQQQQQQRLKSPKRLSSQGRGLDGHHAVSKPTMDAQLALRQTIISRSLSTKAVALQEPGSTNPPVAICTPKKKKPLNPIQKTSSTENILASARQSHMFRAPSSTPTGYIRETLAATHLNSSKRSASVEEDKENVVESRTIQSRFSSNTSSSSPQKSQKHFSSPHPEAKQVKRSKKTISSEDNSPRSALSSLSAHATTSISSTSTTTTSETTVVAPTVPAANAVLAPFTLNDASSSCSSVGDKAEGVVNLMTCFDQWTSDLGNDKFAFNLTSAPVASEESSNATQTAAATTPLGLTCFDPSPAAPSVTAILTPLTSTIGMTPTPGTTALDVADLADLADLTDLTDFADLTDDATTSLGGGGVMGGDNDNHNSDIQATALSLSVPRKFVSEDTTELDDSELDQLLYSEIGEDFSVYSNAFSGSGSVADPSSQLGGADLYGWYPADMALAPTNESSSRAREPRASIMEDTESILPSDAFSTVLSTDPLMSSPGDLSQPLDLDLDFSLSLMSSQSLHHPASQADDVDGLEDHQLLIDSLTATLPTTTSSTLSRKTTPALDSTASTLSSGLSELSGATLAGIVAPPTPEEIAQVGTAAHMLTESTIGNKLGGGGDMYAPMGLDGQHSVDDSVLLRTAAKTTKTQKLQSHQNEATTTVVSASAATGAEFKTPTKRPLGRTTLSSPMPLVSSPTLSAAQMMMYLTGNYSKAAGAGGGANDHQKAHHWLDAWGSELSDPGVAASGSDAGEYEDEEYEEEEEGAEEELDRGVGGYYGRPSQVYEEQQQQSSQKSSGKSPVPRSLQPQRQRHRHLSTTAQRRQQHQKFVAQPSTASYRRGEDEEEVEEALGSGRLDLHHSLRQYFDQLPA